MIDRFDISDVARINGIRILKGPVNGETYCQCPFCGDKRGKFSYIVKKVSNGKLKENKYRCFNCDAGGNAIDLHMQLNPSSEYIGEEGYKKVCKDIFSALNGNSTFITDHYKMKEEMTHIDESQTEIRDDESLSQVYMALASILPLRDEHKADLLRRGLTEDDIRKFRFCSVPYDTKAACRKLISEGLVLEGIPGFYKDRRGEWDMKVPRDENYKPVSAYFCPAYDGERNLLLGYQIRVMNPQKGAKYVWFSSVGKQCGTSSGTQANIIPGENDKIIILTEGLLKATVIYCLLNGKVTVIGIPGTKNRSCLTPYLTRYENNAYVFEAFDMDKRIKVSDLPLLEEANQEIERTGITLETLFKEQEEKYKPLSKPYRITEDVHKITHMVSEYGIGVHPLEWDMDKNGRWKDNYKGLDDFLNEYTEKDKFINYLLRKVENQMKMRQFLLST